MHCSQKLLWDPDMPRFKRLQKKQKLSPSVSTSQVHLTSHPSPVGQDSSQPSLVSRESSQPSHVGRDSSQPSCWSGLITAIACCRDSSQPSSVGQDSSQLCLGRDSSQPCSIGRDSPHRYSIGRDSPQSSRLVHSTSYMRLTN